MKIAAGVCLFSTLSASAALAQGWPAEQIANAESGHRNIPNYRFDATHTAAAIWQITDTNWRHYAPMVDIDLDKYPNAMSAPEQIQGQVAGLMWAHEKCLPWGPYNQTLRRSVPACSGSWSGAAVKPIAAVVQKDEQQPPQPMQWRELTAVENLDADPPSPPQPPQSSPSPDTQSSAPNDQVTK